MTEDDPLREIVALLREMRDRQKETAASTERLLAFLKAQSEKTSTRVEESIALQKVAVARQRGAMWVAVPLILFCLALIAYLIVTYL